MEKKDSFLHEHKNAINVAFFARNILRDRQTSKSVALTKIPIPVSGLHSRLIHSLRICTIYEICKCSSRVT